MPLSDTVRHHQILGFKKLEEILPTFLPTLFLVIDRIFKISRKVIILNKLFLVFLIFGFNTPANAEQYQRHKYTCPESQGECSEGERAAIKLVNDTYWEMLSERIKDNKFYKYPWYWVYKKEECKYSDGAKEDMPTHTVTMEWIDVDICKKTTKLLDLGRR